MNPRFVHIPLIAALGLSACAPQSGAAPTLGSAVTRSSVATTAPTAGARQGQASDSADPGPGNIPPQAAITACAGQAAQDACAFTSDQGAETGVCEPVQDQLACSPRPAALGDSGRDQPDGTRLTVDANGAAYNIDQAISDKAQGMTIAYDALAFMTGDLGADSFFPPGKVADFWGFQYLRDNDPSQMGHAGDFLTSAALNMLNTLTVAQRAELVALAQSQVSAINEYAFERLVLIQAFRRLLENTLPAGTTGLDPDAVKAYSAQLYRLDGEISFARAQLMGRLINTLDATQKAHLDAMVGQGMLSWPTVEEPDDIRGLDRDVKVAVMTYAADMYSWYAGSVEADVYFCPERHGTYFGSFYLKDIHAMSDPTYAIPTNLTGDMGEALLETLTVDQARQITGLVDVQKPALQSIVAVRRQIATELRKFLAGGTADQMTVLGLMEQYGQLDGTIIYNLAVSFTQVAQSLTDDQKSQLLTLRRELLGDLMYPSGAYLYSQAIAMPEIPNTDFLFR